MVLLPILLIGCAKEISPNNDLPDDMNGELSEFNPNKPVVFGESLNIPHTIQNMTIAFNNLSPENRSRLSADDVIFNTHNYIRFTFYTDEQFDFVRNVGIEMYFIPIDLYVIEGGYYATRATESKSGKRNISQIT